MADLILKCHKTGEFSDLLLVCEGHEFKVHKVIVCSQVEPIHAACTGNFEEAQTGIYKFEDESHIVVRKAISYLYIQSYDESQEQGDDNATSEFSELQLHARVFAFADRYRIPRLMSFSADKYLVRLKLFDAQPLVKEDKGKGTQPGPLYGISHNILEFLDSVPAVFNLTPESTTILRNICLDFAHKKFPLASLLDGFGDPYKKTLLEAPGFANQLLSKFLASSLGSSWDHNMPLEDQRELVYMYDALYRAREVVSPSP
ncbi:hypothetical protein N7493_008966 [Penicillium malachiteum]|uniref:BTB domain-containing protein n=1 Tax=Penicillium malachiteum TaxID=1324776 RepID=A0AAD6HFP5_9EURO|nr:hypothetical protein N7493_008966 [Penicillium malachiteum]